MTDEQNNMLQNNTNISFVITPRIINTDNNKEYRNKTILTKTETEIKK